MLGDGRFELQQRKCFKDVQIHIEIYENLIFHFLFLEKKQTKH